MPAHKVRNAQHAAVAAPKPAAILPQPRRRQHPVKAALHGSRGEKYGDVEVLDLVSDATSDSEESDSDSEVEILDAPFVDNEVLVLSDDDDDDGGLLARAYEAVLSSDEEDDDSDDQVVIVSDHLAQGPPNHSANMAGKAAPPARFRKARDPAADLKWFMPYTTAPKNQDVRLVVLRPLLRSSRSLTLALLSPPRTAVPVAAQTWPVSVSDESSVYPGTARYSAAVGGRAGKDSVARLKGRLSPSSPPRRRPPRTPRSVHTLNWSQVLCNTLGTFLPLLAHSRESACRLTGLWQNAERHPLPTDEPSPRNARLLVQDPVPCAFRQPAHVRRCHGGLYRIALLQRHLAQQPRRARVARGALVAHLFSVAASRPCGVRSSARCVHPFPLCLGSQGNCLRGRSLTTFLQNGTEKPILTGNTANG